MKARLLFIACALTCATLAEAHDARPNFVEIIETDPNVFSVQWKIPATVPDRALPTIRMPDSCTTDARLAMQQSGGAYQGRLVYECPDGLSGRQVSIEFPIINPSLSSLFQVRLLNGEQYVRILKPEERSWTVPDAENKLAVAGQYTLLGIEHIWIGIDHLLFVACLLLIARTPRKVLITITGFTLAHSITLALAALDVIRIPTPPVEAAIALSVVFLAWEIVKDDPTQLTYRYPVAVSMSFGLLHGLGFAAVLRDIGLPQTELPTALLFFNVGVEIGQILFVLALVAIFLVTRPVLKRLLSAQDHDVHWSWITTPASYAIGGVASYWLIDRISGFW
ncbi:MAG TPA: HupE/UreJ family protein [Woeseiaceae bacterium]|nr:HupE/UreJ family protein [Woeseiaceae bacterium]